MAMQNTNEFGVQIDTYGAHGEGEGDAEGDDGMRYIKTILDRTAPYGAGFVTSSQVKAKQGGVRQGKARQGKRNLG